MSSSIRLLMVWVVTFSLLVVLAGRSFADDVVIAPPKVKVQAPDARPRTINIIIKDHRFEPAELTLMPQDKVILRVTNTDSSAEEFESVHLKREKVVPGNGTIDIGVGPLRPGVYDFFGDYHKDTAQGKIIVPSYGKDYDK
jgi:plastocyanin